VDLFIVADDLVRYRDQKKEIEEALKEINELIAQTEEQLVAAMVEEEMQNFTRNGGSSF
jgi:predicted translin family RNA/ssDNA-binding protein